MVCSQIPELLLAEELMQGLSVWVSLFLPRLSAISPVRSWLLPLQYLLWHVAEEGLHTKPLLLRAWLTCIAV